MKRASSELQGKNTVTNTREMLDAITNMHKELRLFERNTILEDDESDTLKQLLELHACRSEWDRVVELASQGVVIGAAAEAELFFYRCWIEGLRVELHVEGLQELGRHLISRRKEGDEYIGLALLCYAWAGKENAARSALEQLYRQGFDNPLINECVGLAHCDAMDKNERRIGLKLLSKVYTDVVGGYASLKAIYEAATENNDLDLASSVLKTMNKKYPLAPEPYQVAGLLAITEGNLQEANNYFSQNLAINPLDSNSIILKARCLELLGNYAEARNFLRMRESFFPEGDYEFNVQLGMIEKKLFAETGNEGFKNEAIGYLETALRAAPLFGMPEVPLIGQLENLRASASVKSLTTIENSEQKYWLLELSARSLRAMLEKKNFLLSCPIGADKGDIIFFSAYEINSAKNKVISGFFKVESAPRLDAVLGAVVEVASPVAFDREIIVERDENFKSCQNAKGGENFSKLRRAFFFEIEKKGVEKMVSDIELGSESKSWLRTA